MEDDVLKLKEVVSVTFDTTSFLDGLFYGSCTAFFLDAGLLTCQFAQVVQFGATHFTVFVNGDRVNVG